MASARRELAPRLAFHAWVQQRCAEQLTGVRAAAHEAGMSLGILHDLAVGVDADGAGLFEDEDPPVRGEGHGRGAAQPEIC